MLKETILKESPNTDEETLEHCLTAIQAMLDMDDFERAHDYLNGFVSEIISQTREETIGEAIRKIEKIKIAVVKQTGAYKYNSCYEDCIDILNKLKK
jgi:hypothetical protein